MKQQTVPCIIYRGGTSRGVFFNERDLPSDKDAQERIFLSAIDAYNPSQVNGLGGGTSHTSKVIVVRGTDREDACLAYTFYQTGIGEPVIDAEGTCGNLMAAVGAYAVDEGWVDLPEENGIVEVTVLNENIDRLIRLEVPVEDGMAKVDGDYLMSGIVHPGAKIGVSILQPGGGKTGSTFPAGRQLELKDGIQATFSDIVNPFVFVQASDLGIDISEPNEVLGSRPELLAKLEELRLEGAVASGMAKDTEGARAVPSIPKIAVVAPPCDYRTASGKLIRKEEVDIVSRMVSMGRFHRTFAGSGLYNLAAVSLIEGTVPNACTTSDFRQTVRIGHPDGIAEVTVELSADGRDAAAVGLDRTARRIMEGKLYVPDR